MSSMENAPDLDIDKVLYNRGRPMLPHVRREWRIVWNLIKHLNASGWAVVKVYDGDEYTHTVSEKQALEVIFNLDDAQVGFKKEGPTKTHYVKLVLGNDLDIISDWNYSEGDPDGFNAVMEKFDAEVFA